MRALLTFVLAAVAAGLAAAPAPAADPYPWTIGEVRGPDGTTRIRPEALNASRVVVGRARFPGGTYDRPFRWENGTMVELPLPPEARHASAMDINDKGVIVGYYYWDTEPTDPWGNEAPNAIMWPAGGTTYTKLPCCHTGYTQDRDSGSAANGINESGVVTGSAHVLMKDDPHYAQTHAFTWNGGAYTDLNPVARDRTSIIGYEINEAGTVAAYGLFGPDRTALIPPGGGSLQIIDVNPGLNGLNDAGKVVGERHYQDGKKEIARMWDGSQYVELGVESTYSMANAINNNDWVVGRSGIQSYQPGGGTGYLWRPNAPAASLHSLVPGTGWGIETGTDINDDNTVVGVGAKNGQAMGYIMAPAGIAYQLTGRVVDHLGAPVAGVEVRVLRKVDGQAPPGGPVKTGADGRYTWTLPPGDYRATALAEGAFGVVPGADCTVVGVHCDVAMSRNRTADFKGVAPKSSGGSSNTGGGGGGGGGGVGPASSKPGVPLPAPTALLRPRDTTGPALSLGRSGGRLRVDARGLLRFALGRFAEAVTGEVVLQAGRKRLARKAFRAAAGTSPKVGLKLDRKTRRDLRRRRRMKAKAVVTATDANGNKTTQSLPVTLRS